MIRFMAFERRCNKYVEDILYTSVSVTYRRISEAITFQGITNAERQVFATVLPCIAVVYYKQLSVTFSKTISAGWFEFSIHPPKIVIANS